MAIKCECKACKIVLAPGSCFEMSPGIYMCRGCGNPMDLIKVKDADDKKQKSSRLDKPWLACPPITRSRIGAKRVNFNPGGGFSDLYSACGFNDSRYHINLDDLES